MKEEIMEEKINKLMNSFDIEMYKSEADNMFEKLMEFFKIETKKAYEKGKKDGKNEK